MKRQAPGVVISYDELRHAEEDSSDEQLRRLATLLLAAVTDWPTYNLSEPVDLLSELAGEIDAPLTFENISKYNKLLCDDILENAWKIEAMASLLKLFDLEGNGKRDEGIRLDQIIEMMTHRYRSVDRAPRA